MTILYLLPLLTVMALLVLRKATLLQAGIVGLLLTVPAAYLAKNAPVSFSSFLVLEAAKGAWLAWLAISVILASLFFYHTIKAASELFEQVQEKASPFSYRTLFSVCFLLGPFFESATGFGVGLIITVPFLLRMGISGPVAVLFGLFSQILVPWGALATGTVVGAGIAGIPLAQLGIYSALLSGPLLAAYLLLFWRYASQQGLGANTLQKVDDILWVVALFLLLYLCNRFMAVETAGMFAAGVLLVLRYWRDSQPTLTGWLQVLKLALPYVLLVGILLATRAIGVVGEFLKGLWIIRPLPDLPPFPVFYHVSFLLLATALLYGAGKRITWPRWRLIGGGALSAAKIPVVVTLVFVVMAQIMTSAGIAVELAKSWEGLAGGTLAVLASPVFAAIAGFLTGSNVASNAMLMPMQTALSAHSTVSSHWIAAIQNTAGSNLTMLSPIRVAMGCALLKTNAEHQVYRLALPMGFAATGTLVLMANWLG
ncbi:MAG: L-lactate permease [Sulfuricella sp.]